MYRTLAYVILQKGIDIKDEAAVSAAVQDIDVKVRYEDDLQKMYVGEMEVTPYIRTAEVGEASSAIAVYGGVRGKLLNMQRGLAEEYEVIMDGRDIGTAILPNAPLKIYLTADAEERGRRRFLELEAKDPGTHNLEEIIQGIKDRDYRDSHREIAPLRQAEDAIVVDTTHISAEEAAQRIIQLAQEVKG
jgi:cytidylate kinase